MSSDCPPSNATDTGKICRVVIQQCLQAHLKFDTEDEPVAIGTGMVVFVCFLQGASLDRIAAIVKSIMGVKLCEPETSASGGSGEGAKRKSVLDCNYDILVVPQATLGGKMKGTTTQYHGLVSKDLGSQLFQNVVDTIKEYQTSKGWKGKVECGIYGARQILSMDTNGPFTHIFEF